MAKQDKLNVFMKHKKLIFVLIFIAVGVVIIAIQSFAGSCSVGNSKGCSTVKRGSKSETVKVLQKELNGTCAHLEGNLGIPGLVADGIFGSQTERVVKSFQKRNRLDVDGIVGPKTWNKLDIAYKASRKKDARCDLSGIPAAPK